MFTITYSMPRAENLEGRITMSKLKLAPFAISDLRKDHLPGHEVIDPTHR